MMANTDSTRSLNSDDGAEFARKYLRDLKSDPSSVDLDGFVNDMKHQSNEQVGAFFDVLQDALVGATSRNPHADALVTLADSVNERTAKVRGICALVALAEDKWDEMPSDAVSNAMWVVRDLLTDLEKITHRTVLGAYKAPGIAEVANG